MEPNLHYQLRDIHISRRSRWTTVLLRFCLKPFMRWIARGSWKRIAKTQLLVAGQPCTDTAGLVQDYRIIGRVPGPTVGAIDDTQRPVVLWLHGGAFLLPASPVTHLRLLAAICRDLAAAGFMPDYRLAPFNTFPAALDDAEGAYRGLLELGFSSDQIVLAGESAGGHLTLGLLQRIRKADLGMPRCATLLSPVTDLGRAHHPPSRTRNASRDAIIPVSIFHGVDAMFGAHHDASDPELSPLYADYTGFPPLLFMAGENEALLDDSVLAARQAEAAGVTTILDVWPTLPHAFPLFEKLFPEAAQARDLIVRFMQTHLSDKT